MTSNICTKCGSRFEKNLDLVEHFVLVRCPGCKVYHLEGDARLFREAEHENDGELLRAIRQRAVEVERSRDIDWRIKAAIESDDDDPRWSRGW
jgi:hypothetical protein